MLYCSNCTIIVGLLILESSLHSIAHSLQMSLIDGGLGTKRSLLNAYHLFGWPNVGGLTSTLPHFQLCWRDSACLILTQEAATQQSALSLQFHYELPLFLGIATICCHHPLLSTTGVGTVNLTSLSPIIETPKSSPAFSPKCHKECKNSS